MLPRSRVLAIFMVGVGALLITMGLLAPRFIVMDDRLPADIKQWTVRMVDDETGQFRQYHADFSGFQTAQLTSVRLGVSKFGAPDNSASAGEPSDTQVKADPSLDHLLSAAVYSFRMNRLTGQVQGDATVADVIGMPPTSVGLAGLWLKFPADAHPQAYGFYDAAVGKAFLANYVAAAHIDPDQEPLQQLRGLEQAAAQGIPAPAGGADAAATGNASADRTVLHYKQLVPPTMLDGENYQAVRDIWVDQRTGLILNVREVEYRGQQRFAASFSDDTITQMVTLLGAYPDTTARQNTANSIVGTGAVILLIGIIGVFGGGRIRRTQARRAS